MRSTIMAAVLAISTLFAAAPAMAGEHGKGGASFPMPAAAFQAKMTARQTKAREHMEKRASSLTADQAKELRGKFDANIAKVNAEVAKAVADGTVTKDEAAAVRAASPHHGGGGGHCDKGKQGA